MSTGDFKTVEYIKTSISQEGRLTSPGELALVMVYDDHEGLGYSSFQRYVYHLKSVAVDVEQRYKAVVAAGRNDDAAVCLASLKDIIADKQGYIADSVHHEILEGADMFRVIDRGAGCPMALCLLYLDAAWRCGWCVEILDIAGHALCRLEHQGERLIFDPAQGCALLQAHDLRALVKKRRGEAAELSADCLKGFDACETIICLCDCIKLRRIEMGEYKKALAMVERMHALVPDEYSLLLDAGVLYAKTQQISEAKMCLESYIQKTPDLHERREAQLLLDELVEG